MKLKLIAIIAVAAISVLARAQQSGPVPKPTKADAQNVVQIITSDKMKTQAYCDLTKLEGQVKAAAEKKDTKTLEALSTQADALIDKLGPEYYKLMDGLEQVDPKSSEAKEFMSILHQVRHYENESGRRSGGCGISVTEFTNQGSGIYLSNPACTWLSGQYIYALAIQVTRNNEVLQGGALAKLTVP